MGMDPAYYFYSIYWGNVVFLFWSKSSKTKAFRSKKRDRLHSIENFVKKYSAEAELSLLKRHDVNPCLFKPHTIAHQS